MTEFAKILYERAVRLYRRLYESGLKYSKDFKNEDVLTQAEKGHIKDFAKKMKDDTFEGQKKVFKAAADGSKVAQNLIWSKLTKPTKQLYHKVFLGKNKELAFKKHGSAAEAFGTYIALAYDSLLSGYKGDVEKGEVKKYAGKEVQYSPLKVFDPTKFEKTKPDLYEKFAWIYYQYTKTTLIEFNINFNAGGVADIPGKMGSADRATQSFDLTTMGKNADEKDDLEAKYLGFTKAADVDIFDSLDEEDMLDAFGELEGDPRFWETKKGPSLAETLKTIIEVDISNAELGPERMNQATGKLYDEVFARTGLKRGTFLNRINDLKEILSEYEINFNQLLKYINDGNGDKIIEILSL